MEVAGKFVEACGNAPELLELGEASLDDIALSLDRRVDRALDLAVALGGDVGAAAARGDEVDDGSNVVAMVREQGLGAGERQSGLVRHIF